MFPNPQLNAVPPPARVIVVKTMRLRFYCQEVIIAPAAVSSLVWQTAKPHLSRESAIISG